MIEYINGNSTLISIVTSFLTLVTTIVYVIINSLMHLEMVKSRKLLQKPDVSIRLEKIKSGFMNLILENNTPNDVYNLKFLEYPKSLIGNNEDVPGFLLKGISYLSAKQSYESFFINYPYLVQKNQHEQTIKFHLKYSNSFGKSFEKIVEINLGLLYNNKYLA
ncbi:hypothetical protein [Leptospira sp. GIMC2001]|uniref:hypothetical protein n=1 Tax=Leptospira sp. GIMC2001 TaxID=1513297 RepID=UPI00234AC546|nr:hypothetical protein [Leptospira sp. GIMC2001]WCL50659.1 hypothetical protein O4O04_07575 [Leptospira sp. GIMC2001]